MKITSERTGEAVVVTIGGPLDAAACEQFHADLIPLVTSAIADGTDVIVDFAAADKVHDFAMRTLMLAAKNCKPTKTRIAFARLQPLLEEKLAISRYDKIFPWFPTVDEALETLGADRKIRHFEDSVLLRALAEIAQSPRLLTEFAAEVVTKRPHADAGVEELLASLTHAFRRRAGPSLVLSNRERPSDVSAVAGHYVMTTLYDVDGDQVFAAPAVIFWMRFNNKLHLFDHRYDHAVPRYPVQDVTRKEVLDHVLRSFDFYKVYALSDQPFPGYR